MRKLVRPRVLRPARGLRRHLVHHLRRDNLLNVLPRSSALGRRPSVRLTPRPLLPAGRASRRRCIGSLGPPPAVGQNNRGQVRGAATPPRLPLSLAPYFPASPLPWLRTSPHAPLRCAPGPTSCEGQSKGSVAVKCNSPPPFKQGDLGTVTGTYEVFSSSDCSGTPTSSETEDGSCLDHTLKLPFGEAQSLSYHCSVRGRRARNTAHAP